MNFEFSTAAGIVFGRGALERVGAMVAPWGRRARVVTGRSPKRAERLVRLLGEAGISVTVFSISGEPRIDDLERALIDLREDPADFVIGFGGGSAIDAAKAIAGLATNPGGIDEHLEVVGRAQPLRRPALPWMAIPTTAGTGAEVTRNAVLTVPGRRIKVSLRSPGLLARIALVDPELSAGQPRQVAVASGMDALTQLIEAWVCTRANPMTDAICAEAIPRAARALPGLLREPVTDEVRSDLAWAALASGLALANAGLGAVHGLAAPLGGRMGAAHGAICASLLAPVMARNIAVSREVRSDETLRRSQRLAEWLTGKPGATAEEGAAWARDLVAQLGCPGLGPLGVDAAEFEAVAADALRASSMKANPVPLSAADLVGILRLAF